jgi:hypothetical protein
MEVELTTLDIASVKVDRLHELLMNLPIVEKPLTIILINCDNQTTTACRFAKLRVSPTI